VKYVKCVNFRLPPLAAPQLIFGPRVSVRNSFLYEEVIETKKDAILLQNKLCIKFVLGDPSGSSAELSVTNKHFCINPLRTN
jgi:hypothetical protein